MLVLGPIALAIAGCCLVTVVVEGIRSSAGLRARVLAVVGLLLLAAALVAAWIVTKMLASALAQTQQPTRPGAVAIGLAGVVILLALFALTGAVASAFARRRRV